MVWRFNPPPGWPPAPPGFAPAPGWQPDPSWPPAPPGWQFWVQDAAAPLVEPVEQVTTDSQQRELVRLAPLPRRLGAFMVDGAAVAVSFGVAALLGQIEAPDIARFMLVTVAVALGVALAVVPGLSVWLTGGQTVGKALFGLTERRVGGTKPKATLGGLAWAVGRHSWGYLVIDVLGVGALAALVSPRRRCLHDLAFGSEVVWAGQDDGAQAGVGGAGACLRGRAQVRPGAQPGALRLGVFLLGLDDQDRRRGYQGGVRGCRPGVGHRPVGQAGGRRP